MTTRVVLLFCMIIDSFAGYAQSQTITLEMRKATLLQVIEKIEEISDYTFLYSDAHVRDIGGLDLNFKEAGIEQVLSHCLADTKLTYHIEDKTIILIPGEEKRTFVEIQDDPVFLLHGRVEDSRGMEMPGANIYIRNQPGLGKASDEHGNFSLYVRRGDVVVVSSVGYRTEKRTVKDFSEFLHVVLKESVEEMDEIQVVGYGIQRKVSHVGAISNMALEKYGFPVTSFSNAIAGALSGIIGVQRSGEPGEDVSEFWVRGLSTFGAGEKALILIDGVERTTFNDLIPEDMGSFSVLKDATATAVYGARGANGVLLLRTKRGQAGRMRVMANAKLMMSCLPRLADYLHAYDYALLANEAHEVRGEKPLYNPAALQIIRNGLDPDLYPDVDWQQELLKKWTRGAQVNLSCSGGGDIARYYISGSYRTNDAAYRESDHSSYHSNVRRRQYVFRTNLDMNITRSTALAVDFATHAVTMNRPGIGRTDRLWQIQADLNPLVIPRRYSNGQVPCYGADNQASPVVLLNETGYVSEFRNTVETRLELTQDLSRLLPGWKASVSVAYDLHSADSTARTRMPALYQATGRDGQGRLITEQKAAGQKAGYAFRSSNWQQFYFEGKTAYTRNYGNHRFGALLLFNLSRRETSEAANVLDAVPEKYMGVAGRLTWSFRDIYLAECNFGYNGSSNFPKGQRFGLFPSVAVGWRPSEYGWWKKHLAFIRHFKLKYSYGIIGNDQILGTRFPYLTYIDTDAPGYQLGDYGQHVTGGVSVKEEGTRKLSWERADKQNLGLEINVSGKWNVELDYFRDYRRGIFMRRGNMPDLVGIVTRPYGNVGRLRNWGYEGTFTYHDRAGAVDWEVRANFTWMDNKVLEYDETPGKYAYQNRKGKRLELTRGLIALGYFRDSLDILNSPSHPDQVRPGDIKYKDVNGDGFIDEDDVVPIGNSSIPRLQYGFAANVRYKGWDLGLFFRGSGKVDYFLGGNGVLPFVNKEVGNILSVVGNPHNRWIPAWYSGNPQTENPDARFPRLSYGFNKNNYYPSTHWLRNGAYLRLKTLEIGYSFPSAWLRRWHLTRLRLSLMGDNLHVWDKIKYWDPEQASANGAVYPLTRSFVFNVQVAL